ncbi:prepilin peptidase [Ethanoligenens harbinense]|uniref:Prepilin leader peptidase/N-methyltransferase n=1 Tax=Ethanoligenens harbinense (strain DSM 18485 / JCM 12961 / CGMCC 1.5033 / YUAN-3) TaxID=663278 RepID=E6U2Z2_ETHHY|nr:A24 family peptidase [Ethanoligenens harbinense]ADU26359.1 Prepilin peptidase [Ethanoligenens harbinense YUAN-3]AVQ95490.1 prepilin peptidase [Ethanoligenens harbinense YUAN-3]AYF40899.1 prepilin peptidase [Ethanoligenens harbinense]QCN91731.1 prepilin peptidase [Ethanoligenens harbinense]
MAGLLAVFMFLFGLCIGSFLNVCIYRIPKGESIVFGRSHCPACGAAIQNRDLVPVFSWLALKGRCRNCGARIPVRYPAVELLGGLLFLAVYGAYGLTLSAAVYAAFICALVVTAFIDYDQSIIPNGIVLYILAVGVPAIFFTQGTGLIDRVIGFFAASVPLLIAYFVTRGGLGLGDVKLMAAGGFLLGWKLILLSLAVGSIVGAVVGVSLVLRGRKSMRSAVPFGPFLSLGMCFSALYGNAALHAYIGLFVR